MNPKIIKFIALTLTLIFCLLGTWMWPKKAKIFAATFYAALTAIALVGCTAQRWNDTATDKNGVTHSRAWIEIDLYGPLGDRTVGKLDVGDTLTTSHVKIEEQSQKSTLTPEQLIGLLQLLTTRPVTPP